MDSKFLPVQDIGLTNIPSQKNCHIFHIQKPEEAKQNNWLQELFWKFY